MNNAERHKREQDLVFQDIEEMERLECQSSTAGEDAIKRLGSWFKEKLREDLTRAFMRKKFFRAMSEEEQEEFVQNTIREFKCRRSPGSETQG